MGDTISNLAVALLVISWLAVCLRCGVRLFLVKAFGVDDWLMLFCQIVYTFWGACLILGARAGMGKHADSLTPDGIILAMKYFYASGALYSFETVLVKIAVGVYLLRVIVSPVQKYIIWISLLVATGYGTFMLVGLLFQCKPVAKFWDNSIPGLCGGKASGVWSGYVQAAITATVDLILAGVPFFMLRHSTLGWKKRAAIYLIMSLGSFAAVTTLIRLQTLDDLTVSADYLFNLKSLIVWSWVEPGVGIIAGSMATLRPLVRVVFEKTRSFKSATRSHITSTARYDPEVNLDELRGESSATRTNIVGGPGESPPLPSFIGGRRSSRESGNSYGWQSFGSQEHLRDTRIKRSVKVTIQTSDAVEPANDVQVARSPTGIQRIL